MQQSSRIIIWIGLWIIATCLVIALTTTLGNAPSTFAAALGAIVLIAWIVISIESKCFTNIHFKKSNSKPNEKVS